MTDSLIFSQTGFASEHLPTKTHKMIGSDHFCFLVHFFGPSILMFLTPSNFCQQIPAYCCNSCRLSSNPLQNRPYCGQKCTFIFATVTFYPLRRRSCSIPSRARLLDSRCRPPRLRFAPHSVSLTSLLS